MNKVTKTSLPRTLVHKDGRIKTGAELRAILPCNLYTLRYAEVTLNILGLLYKPSFSQFYINLPIYRI